MKQHFVWALGAATAVLLAAVPAGAQSRVDIGVWTPNGGARVAIGGPRYYPPPVYAPPVYAPPVYGAPVYAPPVYAAPVYAAPVYGAPVYGAPVYGAPRVYGPRRVYVPPAYVVGPGYGYYAPVRGRAYGRAGYGRPYYDVRPGRVVRYQSVTVERGRRDGRRDHGDRGHRRR